MVEITQCAHQVGGHAMIDGKPCAYTDTEGRFYKALQSGPRAGRELAFYQAVAKSTNTPFDKTPSEPPPIDDFDDMSKDDLRSLAPFLPKFYGTKVVDESTCLVLSDLCAGLKRACVIDAKLGFTTAYAAQTEAKFESCRVKDLETTQVTLGYRICGFQCWKQGSDAGSDGGYFKGDRMFGKQLTPETMTETFHTFTTNGALKPADVFGPIMEQLAKLEAALAAQKSLNFYAASILIGYEGSATGPHDVDVRLQLVDFAHTLPAGGKPDDNLLGGLRSIMGVFKGIVDGTADESTPAASAEAALAATPGAVAAKAVVWNPHPDTPAL